MTHFHANCSEILGLNVFQTAQYISEWKLVENSRSTSSQRVAI